MRAATILLGLLILSGCTTIERSTSMFPNRNREWREVATQDDQKRLRGWRASFVAAVTASRKDGHGPDIDGEGDLLKPDVAIADPALANGFYKCRVIKVGAKSAANMPYLRSGALICRVSQDGPRQQLVTLGGVQREIGLIFPDDAIHNVFLGTLMLPGETRAMQYGADENRDVVGYVERIGPQRWRLVMPAPHFDSMLAVLELVPSSGAGR